MIRCGGFARAENKFKNLLAIAAEEVVTYPLCVACLGEWRDGKEVELGTERMESHSRA